MVSVMEHLKLSRKQLDAALKGASDAIRGWVENSGADGVVYGLSGGVDSALVCVLASEVDAHALILPEKGVTPRQDIDDAVELAGKAGASYTIHEINGIVDSVKQAYGELGCVPLGNVKARARMILLYAAANEENRVVLGTSNKTELLLGYYTKHGDGAADFLPIGSLYKTQVRQLARHAKVPKRILDKTPSAGLWAGQCDEDELGLDYETLDKILYLVYGERLTPKDAAVELGVTHRAVEEVLERVDANRHKMLKAEVAGPFF